MENPVRIECVELRLDEPHAGWLPLCLRLGEFVLEAEASNVLNDPLQEFVDLTSFAHEPRSGFRRVALWEEPGGYVLDLRHMGEKEVLLSIAESEDFHPPMNNRPMSTILRVVCPRTLLYSTFRTSLQAWVAAHASSATKQWDMKLSARVLEIEALRDPGGTA